MCQIIHKPAGYSLPKTLLTSTCITNPDGFGLMMFDKGKIYADKAYTGKDNDPEEIDHVLKQLHNEECFVHFRYKTKGKISTEDCHPFQAYNDNDREVWLMHNGTFADYGSTTKVDSQEFAEELVGPLYDKFLRAGVRTPLDDEFFSSIVHKFADKGSKVVILDNTGTYLIVNEKSGFVYEDKSANQKFWVSNLYSFNKDHRTNYSSVWTNYGRNWQNYGGSSQSNAPFAKASEPVRTSAEAGQTSVPGQNSTSTTLPIVQTNKTSVPIIKQKEIPQVPQKTARKCYWKDVLGLSDAEELLDMTYSDIEELVDLEPDNAKLLIKDLLFELYVSFYDTAPEADDLPWEQEDNKTEEEVPEVQVN